MSKIRISRLSGERDNAPRGVDLEWSELAALLGADKIAPGPCVVETCGVGEHQHPGTKPEKRVCRHKYGAAWTPAVYPPGATRSNKNVGVVSVLVIDLDHMTDEVLDARIDGLDGYRYIAHPSHSDGLPPRDKNTGEFVPGAAPERAWRVVVALTEPVLAADWPRFWLTTMHRLGIVDRSQGLDPGTCDAARLYFLPVNRADALYERAIVHDGAPLDVRAILAEAPPRAPDRAELDDANDLPPADAALLERCRQRLRDHGPAIEGQGGDRWTFSACAALVHGFGLSVSEAWPLLLEWNATCQPPWDTDELHTKLANATSYASGPRGGARLEWEAAEYLGNSLTAIADARRAETVARVGEPVSYDDEIAAMWDDLEPASTPAPAPAGRPAFDHTRALAAIAVAVSGEPVEEIDPPGFPGAHRRAIRDVVAALGDGETVKQTLRAAPLFVPMRELLLQPAAPTPWLIRGLVKDGGVAMPAAGPKVGKTWFALECACAIATGTRAFNTDRFKASRPRAVAYFFSEDDHASITAHIRAFASGRQTKVDDLARNLHARPVGDHIDITRDADLAYLLASAREIPSLGMLVLDPFRNVHSAKEIDNDEMAVVMQRLHFLARALGCTVMIPHHTKKLTREDVAGGATMAGQAIRGASAVFGALDSIIMLVADEKQSDETHLVIDARAIIKGAKSAGMFGLKLTIIDDDRDMAKHVEWEYLSGAAKKETEAKEEIGEAFAADLAVAMVEYMRLIEMRKEPPRNVDKLRTELKWGTAKVSAACAYAEAKGWISKPKQKWELTDLGRAVDFGTGRE